MTPALAQPRPFFATFRNLGKPPFPLRNQTRFWVKRKAVSLPPASQIPA
jgi:hypothetical protein